MVAPVARDAPAVLRLELVVELLGDALAQLVDERPAVEAGAEPLDERDERSRGAEIGVDRLHDAGVLDLDRDVAAVLRHAAVDLADGGCRDGLRIEVAQHARRRLAPVLAHDALDVLERHPRRLVAQHRQLLLQPLAILRIEVGEVDRREDLAELHGRALHAAELLDDLLGDLRVAPALRLAAALLVAPAVGDPPAGGPGALSGHERADTRRSAEPGSRGSSFGHDRSTRPTVTGIDHCDEPLTTRLSATGRAV